MQRFRKIGSRVVLAILMALGRGGAVDPVMQSADIFVSVDGAKVLQYSQNGTLKRTLTTGRPGKLTGSAFDKSGNLYVSAGFAGAAAVVWFNAALAYQGDFGSGFENNPESIVIDPAGNFLVGAAQHGGAKAVVKKLSPTGNQIRTYSVDTERRGTDWIDLSADRKTIFYTSEGVKVKRFNAETGEQLPDFSDAGGGMKYALRILSDGGILVAASSHVVRFDRTGAIIKTYLRIQDCCLR